MPRTSVPAVRLPTGARRRLAAVLLPLAATLAGLPTLAAQPPLPQGAAERARWAALLRAEDARGTAPGALDTLALLVRDPSPALRRLAVRAVGRHERAALIPTVLPALADAVPAVREAAADALAQAATHGGGAEARAALLPRLGAERDPAVRGALAEALGRVAAADTAQLRVAGLALAAAGAGAPTPTAVGVARGLFALARQPVARGALPAPVVARLQALATFGAAGTGGTRAAAAEVRALAAGALVAGGAVTAPVLDGLQGDPDAGVRRMAARAIGSAALDTAAARRAAVRALADPAPAVRGVAVAAFARRFGSAGTCEALLAAARDADRGVRLAGLDALAGGCTSAAPAVALADSVAAALPAVRGSGPALDPGPWHEAAHALVTLAALDPARARARIPAFAGSAYFYVRDYAARAAARAADTTTLRRLADDAHPNVRTAALEGLARLVGHAADDAFLGALGVDDNQVVMTAATALAGSADARAVPALLDALDRVTAARRETERDARAAILDRVQALGAGGDTARAARLRPYLADYDTLVARRAAEVIGAWTGTRPTPAPRPLARAAVPTPDALDALARARVRLEMQGGGVVELALHPYDAPTSAARFATLVRDRVLDGLTFHRVVPGLLVQGGSPHANEYAGHGAYTREELALPNRRGSVGVSTRGRDTGDGQIYILTADWFELDHNFTILGTVVRGMDVVDRMHEGALIRRATLVTPGR